MKKNYKLIVMIIGIVSFVSVIAGATYAWFTWTSGNVTVGGTTTCFDVDYVKGTNIVAGSLYLTDVYNGPGSITTSVKINRKATCTLSGTVTIKLNTLATTTAALLSSNALKYAVYVGAVSKGTGTITASGTINIASETLPASQTTYNIYIWIDGAATSNSAIDGASYAGNITASATQS